MGKVASGWTHGIKTDPNETCKQREHEYQEDENPLGDTERREKSSVKDKELLPYMWNKIRAHVDVLPRGKVDVLCVHEFKLYSHGVGMKKNGVSVIVWDLGRIEGMS